MNTSTNSNENPKGIGKVAVTLGAIVLGLVVVGIMNWDQKKDRARIKVHLEQAAEKRRKLIEPFVAVARDSGKPLPIQDGIWYFGDWSDVSGFQSMSMYMNTNKNLEVVTAVSVSECRSGDTNILDGIPYVLCQEVGITKGYFAKLREKTSLIATNK